MSQQLKDIQKILKANASEATIASHQKFVPGLTKIYGVKMPVLNQLAKEFKDGGFPLVEELGNSEYIEEKALAAKLLGNIAKKDPEKTFQLFNYFSASIDNWALCDALGMQSLKPLVKTHAIEIFALAKKYNVSPNLWQRRLSLVMVEWYTRDKNYHKAILQLVDNLKNDKEYYVKKAIVWIKRNLEKGR